MLHIAANKTALLLIDKNVISKERFDIYAYGLEELFSSILNAVLVLAAATVLQVIPQTLLMLIPFLLLRPKAGGFHAKTHIGCTLGFLSVYVSVVVGIRFIPDDLAPIASTVMLLISTAVVLFIGAMKHANRTVSDDEYARYKLKARLLMIALFTFGLIGTFIFPGWFLYYSCGTFIAAGSLLTAWMINKRRRCAS